MLERRDTTYRIPALRGGILHVVSRCYVLNQLGNATSDPTAFKIPRVPSSVLSALGLYSRSSIFKAHCDLYIVCGLYSPQTTVQRETLASLKL